MDPIGINIAKQRELFDQVNDQWADIVVVETIPNIIRSAQGDILIPFHRRLILVVDLHVSPLTVIELLGRPSAAVHGNKQGPTILGRLPTVFTVYGDK